MAPKLLILTNSLGNGPPRDDIRYHETASVAQDPVHLSQNPELIRREVDHAVGDDQVDLPVRDRDFLQGSSAKLHIPVAQIAADDLGVSLRPGQRIFGHVYPDNPSIGAHFPGGDETIDPPAAEPRSSMDSPGTSSPSPTGLPQP